MKTLTAITVLLGIAIALLLFNAHSNKRAWEAERAELADSLLRYESRYQARGDSLDYYRLLAEANYRLLNADSEGAMALFQKADDFNMGHLDWTPKATERLASGNEAQQLLYQQRETISQLEQEQAAYEKRFAELQDREDAQADELQALKSKMIETALSLNEAILRNQALENEIRALGDAYGQLTFRNTEGNTISYYGEVKQGKANGFGFAVIENKKSTYRGEWKNNKRHGKGKHNWANGDYYEGEYVDDQREGYGIYQFASGERYEGEWKDDLREGKGTVYSKDGNVLLEGQWAADKVKKKE